MMSPRGSIPAHTGEPNPGGSWLALLRVYPRTYGGTVITQCSQIADKGLSPHIRGNPLNAAAFLQSCGSIPAHTGEPVYNPITKRMDGVYPRTYGGTLTSLLLSLLPWGLSPHIRGNPMTLSKLTPPEGSIPAHTGEPSTLRPAPAVPRVYPRTYGGTPTRSKRIL